MAVDIRERRRTEVDAMCGEVSRLGAAHGVPTPVNDTVAIYGGTIALGRPGSGGQVDLFRHNGIDWPAAPDDQLIPSGGVGGDRVGSSVALEGSTLVAGAPGDANGVALLAGAVFELQNLPSVNFWTGATAIGTSCWVRQLLSTA